MQGIGISKRWRLVGLVALVAAVLSLGAIACSDDEDDGGDSTPEVTGPAEATQAPTEGVAGQLDITAVEYAFENVPTTQPGGLTTITLDNVGGEDHQAQLVKLNDGVTFDQFQTALTSDETGAAALQVSTVAGGVNVQLPGVTGEVTQDLSEGTYVMLCFVSAADGVPHLAKGMIAPFQVSAPGTEQPEAPTADAQIAGADFTFTGDLTLPAGESTVEFTNNGPQPHEMTVVKLDEGFTADQLLAMFTEPQPTPEPGVTPEDQGPPPFSSAGGMGAIMPSTSAFAVVNLEAGNYALLCFVPDQATGAPHAALGMVTALTVQ